MPFFFPPSDSDRIESTGAFHTSKALARPQFESFTLSQRSEKRKLHERTERKKKTKNPIKSDGMKAKAPSYCTLTQKAEPNLLLRNGTKFQRLGLFVSKEKQLSKLTAEMG